MMEKTRAAAAFCADFITKLNLESVRASSRASGSDFEMMSQIV